MDDTNGISTIFLFINSILLRDTSQTGLNTSYCCQYCNVSRQYSYMSHLCIEICNVLYVDVGSEPLLRF